MAPVTYINCFEVPVGQEEEFLSLWAEVNRYMRGQRGYLSHRLHRATTVDVPFRFINVVQWESADLFHAAHDEGYLALVRQPHWKTFRFAGTLFDVVSEGHA